MQNHKIQDLIRGIYEKSANLVDWSRMGTPNSKPRRKIDEACSNSSLSNLRYITVMNEKSKWNVFKKNKSKPIPVYNTPTGKPHVKGCPCGNNGPCKQKVTPKGVTIHYPQKKKKFPNLKPMLERHSTPKTSAYYNSVKPRPKLVRPRKFTTWRMDNVVYNRNRKPVEPSPEGAS